ncbi:HAMP domain-containing sensor histidine kinase [Intestinimonas timonensis]|uniref:sensor histidine kinase n=1 Tax=Intestinimonas timonensis TaxID=1689270 RepID=UPI0023F3F94E|nr:HAMP domain-containing sensor histidine kinase [Intestinimonas timonensis]
MIAGLQKKFILISAASTLAVFSIIFLLLVLFSWDQMEKTMDTLTDAIVSNDGVFPDFEPDDHRGPSQRLPYGEIITEETQFSTRFFTVWLDGEKQILRINMDAISSISRDDVKEYVQKALKEGRERGWVSDYRYRILETGQGATVVFVNGSMNWAVTTRLLVTAFLVLLGSALLILLLTVLLSKRVVRPVAESYEKQKQFITDANHELKTPLTLILSNLDIVEAELGQNEWLDDIRSEGERMGLMINQLVALSRMDESQAHMVRSAFDLSAAVEDTVSEFQPLAAERGKKLQTSIEPGIRYEGDEGLIRRLASILMDNAVKYCDEGGEIRVEVCQHRHPVLIVENTYAQVDQLELDRLFDRFYRADKARTFSGSFGVGLSIAQSIVRSHRGSIHAYRKGNTIGFRAELK